MYKYPEKFNEVPTFSKIQGAALNNIQQAIDTAVKYIAGPEAESPIISSEMILLCDRV